jgi:hypothetical protein
MSYHVQSSHALGQSAFEGLMGKLIEFKSDKWQKHYALLVIITFQHGERFARVYTNPQKAQTFVDRQKKARAVKSVQVKEMR